MRDDHKHAHHPTWEYIEVGKFFLSMRVPHVEEAGGRVQPAFTWRERTEETQVRASAPETLRM